jgi:hypothetical protein
MGSYFYADPKGHSYVCTVAILGSQIEEEVDMLIGIMEAKGKDRQREYLNKVVVWTEKIRDELQPVLDSHRGQVHFRPSSGGVAMIGLDPKRPQLGRSGFRNLKRLRENFDELYRKYCVDCSPGRGTPEKALQSFMIRDAYQNDRKLSSINEASKGTNNEVELIFAVDEIPVPLEGTKRIVCDVLALSRLPDGGYRPVLLELKSSRMMRKLVEQVESYADIVDRHSDLFGEIFSAMLDEKIHLVGSCEKWVVWPRAGKIEDPRQEELAKKGIRVVGYRQNSSESSFRVGPGVNPTSSS